MGKGLAMSRYSLSGKIECLRYTLMAFSVFSSFLAIVVFALSIWLKASPSFNEWIDDMELGDYYIGIYIMLIGACLVFVSSCLSCAFIFTENTLGLKVMCGVYAAKFICALIGTALLLNYSTQNSQIQPMVRRSMQYLIANSHYDQEANMLRLIQENIGCCGADGPNDYLSWKKPLPSECRDTVTGNAFFYGCVDELTWFLGDKSAWLAGVAMVLGFFNILKIVFTVIHVKALNAEGKTRGY